MPKIISQLCELVKLCHINCSGSVFFGTHCIISNSLSEQRTRIYKFIGLCLMLIVEVSFAQLISTADDSYTITKTDADWC